MSGSNNVWFSFTAQGTISTVTVNGANNSRPEISILYYTPTDCDLASGVLVACESNNGNYSSITETVSALVIGRTYYVMVTNNSGGNPGAFDICIDNPAPLPTSGQDCSSAVGVCSNSPFTGNNQGSGIQELNAANSGCLFVENNSSWYTFTAQTSGTIELTISPQNGSDDYDFAIWGPGATCAPTSSPIRCNYAAYPRLFGCGSNTNSTGMRTGEFFTSVGACGSRSFLAPLIVTAGESYVLLVDGYTPASQPFDLNWGGTASLDCSVLNINDLRLSARLETNGVALKWVAERHEATASLEVERSSQLGVWETVEQDLTTANERLPEGNYHDSNPPVGELRYRIRTTSLEGKTAFSNEIEVDFSRKEVQVFPTPATSDVQVRVPDEVPGGTWRLTDAFGQVKATGSIDAAQFTVSRNQFPAGMYTLRVVTPSGPSVHTFIWY